jgi:prepilin-type processing-associated H-X9-DG protein
VYKTLPPAYIADASGRPMHSWRVLILPFMDQVALYEQYRFDEPWDGPNNSQLLSRMPQAYACPSEAPVPGASTTHYLWVVGPNTISDGPTPIGFSQVTDGLANTIAMVESTKAVNWMEPVDLPFNEMSFTINDPSGNAIGSRHANGANVLLMDGSVRYLQQSVDSQTLRNLLMRDDGQAVSLPY